MGNGILLQRLVLAKLNSYISSYGRASRQPTKFCAIWYLPYPNNAVDLPSVSCSVTSDALVVRASRNYVQKQVIG